MCFMMTVYSDCNDLILFAGRRARGHYLAMLELGDAGFIGRSAKKLLWIPEVAGLLSRGLMEDPFS